LPTWGGAATDQGAASMRRLTCFSMSGVEGNASSNLVSCSIQNASASAHLRRDRLLLFGPSGPVWSGPGRVSRPQENRAHLPARSSGANSSTA